MVLINLCMQSLVDIEKFMFALLLVV
jgi:hypothetical protein